MVYRLGAPICCAYCLYRENWNKVDIHKSLDRSAQADCHLYCKKCPNCQRYKSRHDFKDHLELCKRGIQHRFICPICLQRGVPNTGDATTEYTLAKLHMGGIDDASSEDGNQGEIYDFPSETSTGDEESSTTEEGSITLSSELSFSAQSDQSIDSLVQEITSVVRKPKLAHNTDANRVIKPKSLGRRSSGRKRKSPEVSFNDEEPAPKKSCRTETSVNDPWIVEDIDEDLKDLKSFNVNDSSWIITDIEDSTEISAQGHGEEDVSNIKLVTKRRYISDLSSSEDEIKPALKKRRIIVFSDDSSESFAYGSPPLPSVESSLTVDSPVSSPRHSPLPPAAVMPQNQGRRRGRPIKRKCMRLRDSAGRFIPDPNLIRVMQRPKRKRRTELELLLSYSYSFDNLKNELPLLSRHT